MAEKKLIGVEGRTFEFEVIVKDSEGNDYEMQEGDELYFLAAKRDDPDATAPIIRMAQADSHFKIKKLDLEPGMYEFEFGIRFANGDEHPIVRRDEGTFTVYRNAGDVDAEIIG